MRKNGFAGDLSAGVLSAVIGLSYALSYAGLIFGGPLQAYLHTGIQAALTSLWVINLVLALWSGFTFSVGGPDANTTAILAIGAGTMFSTARTQGLPSAQIGATLLALVVTGGILVGLIPLLLGLSRQGHLARLIPYPVSGGFLAGMGYLFTAAAYKMLTGAGLNPQGLPALARVHPLGLAITLLVATLLWFAPRYSKHPLTTPVILLLGGLLFYAGLYLLGLDVPAARTLGLLSPALPAGQLPGQQLSQLLSARWDIVAQQWSTFLALAFIPVISIPLHASAVELGSRLEADFDRELRASGIGSVVAGLLGGLPGFMLSSRTLFHRNAGATSRWANVWSAGLCLAASVALMPAFAYVPKPVLAGLLFPFGLNVLREWLWVSFSKLPWLDYGIVVSTMLVYAVAGLAQGIAFGLAVAVLLYVYQSSKVPTVRHHLSGAVHRSSKERTAADLMRLQIHGKAIHVLALQGYLFFGACNAIVEACRPLLEEGPARYLILDFRLVHGLDVSSAEMLGRLQQLCARRAAMLVLTGLSASTKRVLERFHLLGRPGVMLASDLDHGLEFAEDQLLAEEEEAPDAAASTDASQLLQRAQEWDLVELSTGQALFREGDLGEDLYLVEVGELEAMIDVDGCRVRLRSFGPGTFVGEMALYTKARRSADVVAMTDSRLRRLSAARLAELEQRDPQAATVFHRYVIAAMSARLAASNEAVRALA